MSKTYAVIVTYKPDVEILEKCVNSLANQVAKLIIVDNTPGKCQLLENFRKMQNVEIIYLNENYGIAYAQNVGIKRVLEENIDYILLSDQDTIYPLDYIEKMFKCFQEDKVAAAGPLFIDAHTGKVQFFIKKGLFGFEKIYPTSGKYSVLQLIASGTIINTKFIPEIGLMKEELFIDWVDMEWCWRATKKGFKIIGNADVVIEHYHGEKSKEFLGKNITLKSYVRNYYTIRNGIYLVLYSNVLDIYRRTLLFSKTFRNIFLFSVLSNDIFLNFKYTLKGFYHGLIGKLGKLDEKH